MLGQRRRRLPNIKTALDQCLVWVVSCNQFSGYINAVNLYSVGYCWPTLDRPRHARFEAEWFFKCLARVVTKSLLVFCHITPFIKSLHWLTVRYKNKFKLIWSLTFQALTSEKPLYSRSILESSQKVRKVHPSCMLREINRKPIFLVRFVRRTYSSLVVRWPNRQMQRGYDFINKHHYVLSPL